MSIWMEKEKRYYMNVFNRLPVTLVKGSGVRVWDDMGKSYLDMLGGIAVNILGHCHPAVVKAICDQSKELIHTSNLYYTKPQLELAELLVSNTCGEKVFFCNSGAEANEAAIKLARRYGKLNRNGAYEIISTIGSFHGRTLATIAATGQEKFQKPFEPMPDGFKNVPYNDLDAVKEATTNKTCAILIECIQGESGVHPASQAYVRGLRQWCDENNLLFIVDEIQTGLGRTGKFLAIEHFGVIPDIFTLAKGLAGGVPIGAALATEKASVFGLSEHGSTFGGNPLACAAGKATVQVILSGLIEKSVKLGQFLQDKFLLLKQKYPFINEIRGLGLMVGIDVESGMAPTITTKALENGLIINYTGPNTIRMLPPLIITDEEIDEAISILDKIFQDL